MSHAPIVFLHRNCPSVESFPDSDLGVCVRQAATYHPGVPILLIGDQDPCVPNLCEFVPLQELRSVSRELAAIYRHTSGNDRDYEFFCIDRWLILAEVMRRRGDQTCLHLDSDVLVFGNLFEELAQEITSCEVACCQLNFAALASVPGLHSARFFSMHTAFVRRDLLEEFSRFLEVTFGDPHAWEDHLQFCRKFLEGGIISGVNDMSLWSDFLAGGNRGIFDLCQVIRDATVDFNSNASLGFAMRGSFRAYEWIDGSPVAEMIGLGRRVRHRTIHCQGAAKERLMELASRSFRAV